MEDIKDLINRLNEQDLKILIKAKNEAQIRVNSDPSRGNLDALEKASKMLADFLAGDKEPAFENLLRVKEHLNRLGYKVGKSKIYKDRKDGLIRIEADGTVKEASVKAYIRKANLENLTEKAAADQGPSVLVQKAEKELEKLHEQIEDLRFKRSVAQGDYIPRTDFEMELAARAAVLDTGLRHLVHSSLGNWVALMDGDPKKIPLLLRRINDDLDEKFNEFATMQMFHVIFTDE